MAESYRFFGSAVGDTRQYNQPQFAEVLKTFIGNGYMADIDSELAVIASTPNAMSVKVGTGQGWINGYWYKNDASKTITIAAADATNPRIDLVVLRLDTINARSIVATVITGTPASVPVVPSLTQTEQLWEIPLAQVYVGAAVSTIVTGNITDRRSQALMQDTDEILAVVDTKAPIASPTFTGTVSGITKSMVGLGNVDNTSDVNKPISNATQTALDGKLSLTGGTLTGALNGTTIATSSHIVGQNLKIRGDALEEHKTDGEAQVSINYYGYNSGTTQFRNFTIYDGKASQVARFLGSDKSLTLYGNLNTNGQIKFPATQNPSADANTLDDYEEGTWTPNVGGNATYSLQDGKYVKVGKLVFIVFNMTINTLGTGNNAGIFGLPFEILQASGISFGQATNLAGVVSSLTGIPYLNQIAMRGFLGTGANSTDVAYVFGNGTNIQGHFCYITNN